MRSPPGSVYSRPVNMAQDALHPPESTIQERQLSIGPPQSPANEYEAELNELSFDLNLLETSQNALYLPSDFAEGVIKGVEIADDLTKVVLFQGDNLDWSLIKVDSKSYKPNLLAHPPLELIAMTPNRAGLSDSQDVMILCGESGVLEGTMELRHSSILIEPGNRFVDTFDLRLAGGKSKYFSLFYGTYAVV
jgi:hypothetical protein